MTGAKAAGRMSYAVWVAAFMRHALATDAVGMWSLAASLTHLDLCLRVGEEGRAKKQPFLLAMRYDEFCRKNWSELARAGVHGFNINLTCLGIDRDIVSRAESSLVVAKQNEVCACDIHCAGCLLRCVAAEQNTTAAARWWSGHA